MTEAWIRLPLPLRKLAPGTALKAVLLHHAGAGDLFAREPQRHPVGIATVTPGGMAKLRFSGTQAARDAQALLADGLVDVAAGDQGRLLMGNFRDVVVDQAVEMR